MIGEGAKHRGVLQPAVAFLSQPAGGESFELPKQRVFRACEGFGFECCGASVLLSASRLAGESGSRLPAVHGLAASMTIL